MEFNAFINQIIMHAQAMKRKVILLGEDHSSDVSVLENFFCSVMDGLNSEKKITLMLEDGGFTSKEHMIINKLRKEGIDVLFIEDKVTNPFSSESDRNNREYVAQLLNDQEMQPFLGEISIHIKNLIARDRINDAFDLLALQYGTSTLRLQRFNKKVEQMVLEEFSKKSENIIVVSCGAGHLLSAYGSREAGQPLLEPGIIGRLKMHSDIECHSAYVSHKKCENDIRIPESDMINNFHSQNGDNYLKVIYESPEKKEKIKKFIDSTTPIPETPRALGELRVDSRTNNCFRCELL